MKNVILIARRYINDYDKTRREIVERILACKGYQISLLVIHPLADKTYYQNIPGIKRVFTSLEIENIETTDGLDYEIIQKQKYSQLHIENYLRRLYNDYQIEKYYYYNALSFWNKIFTEDKIDIVITTQVFHGWVWDIANALADVYGAKSYYVEQAAYNNTYSINDHGKLVPIYMNAAENLQYVLNAPYDIRKIPPNKKEKDFLQKVAYKIGGNIFQDFLYRLRLWNWKPRSAGHQRASMSLVDKMVGYLKIKYIEFNMKRLSILPDFNRKYVFYALHLEPEAAIQNRTVLESQLTVIKMLSETLPTGWMIYVKEHPMQFDVNNDENYVYFTQVMNYKTKRFYESIIKIPNVSLIDVSTNTDELIENAQAIASILGTVLYEGVAAKKPVLVFSDLCPIAYMEESFAIHSYFECYQAMKAIEKGVEPNYNDCDDVIRRYIFKGEFEPDNILELLRLECPSDEV